MKPISLRSWRVLLEFDRAPSRAKKPTDDERRETITFLAPTISASLLQRALSIAWGVDVDRATEIAPHGLASEIDWDAQPLGRVSDYRLAAALNVERYLVMRQRALRGIPSARETATIDWSAVKDLGTVPDSVIAKRLGCTATMVALTRRRKGVAAAAKNEKFDLTGVTLGTESDRATGRRLGCSHLVIARERKKRRIPVFGG